MPLKVGIIGLPNVGKSTLFNALTKLSAAVSNYPFTTIDPNIGIVEVRDERTSKISQIMRSKKTTEAAIEFVDIAGLVKGASKGEGLGNQFLANIREVDAIAHVVRCFDDGSIVHVEGAPDPARDIDIINSEILLADLKTIEKKESEAQKEAKTGDKKAKEYLKLVEKIKLQVEKGFSVNTAQLSHEERTLLGPLFLLSMKPQIFVANVGENHFSEGKNDYVPELADAAKKCGAPYVVICSKLESEIFGLEKAEADIYLKDIGMGTSKLPELINAGYKALGLITFFTANENETRAWPLEQGTKLPSAAGRVHSDMEKGFISAEVIEAGVLIKTGNYHDAKEKGLVRLEGKNYEVKDGDVVTIRFNVC